MVLAVKNPPANAGDIDMPGQSLGWKDPLEEGMAIHSSIPAWRISRTEEPGGLQGHKEWDTTEATEKINHGNTNFRQVVLFSNHEGGT